MKPVVSQRRLSDVFAPDRRLPDRVRVEAGKDIASVR
jgi:hypothetical protein